MYDRFINLNELLGYSDHFLTVVPAYRDLDPVVERVITLHSGLRDRVGAIVRGSEDARSGLSMSQGDRRKLEAEVQDKLTSLYHYVKSQASLGSVDPRRFFPTLRLSDIGLSMIDRRKALNRCVEGLELYPQMEGYSTWKATLTDLQSRYAPKVDEISSRDSQKRATTQELATLRADWKRNYLASKRIMEGLLILNSRQGEYKGMFLDLQTAAPAKKAAPTPGATTDSGPTGTPEGATNGAASSSPASAATSDMTSSPPA